MKRMPATINFYCVLDTFFPIVFSAASPCRVCILCANANAIEYLENMKKGYRRHWHISDIASLVVQLFPNSDARHGPNPNWKLKEKKK